MANGIASDNLPGVSLVDSLVGNLSGSTVKIPVDAAAAVLGMNATAVNKETRVQLYADLSWPAGTRAAVWGDAIESYRGIYIKSGDSGTGSWSRIGDLPQSALTTAQLSSLWGHIEVEVARATEEDATLSDRIDAIIATGAVVGSWDASTNAFPTTRPDNNPIQAGDTWRVTVAGTVDGEAFAVGDYLQAIIVGGGTTFAGHWSRSALGQIAADRAAAEAAAVTAASGDDIVLDTAYGLIGATLDTLTYEMVGISAGATVRAGDSNWTYSVLASDALDYDYVGSAGVKVAVLTGAGWVSAAAFGMDLTGAMSSSQPLERASSRAMSDRVNVRYPAATIRVTDPIAWNPYKFSVSGSGDTLLDCSDATDISDAVVVATDGTEIASGMAWRPIMHKLERFAAIGHKLRDFMKLDFDDVTSTPQVHIESFYLNTWRDAITLGSKQWCSVIRDGHIRDADNGLVLDGPDEAGENQTVQNVTFNGGGNALIHRSGSAHLKFRDCSFDYLSGTIAYADNPDGSLYLLIDGCNLENAGDPDALGKLMFDLTYGTSRTITLKICNSFFYINPIDALPKNLAAIVGGSSQSSVALVDNTFAFYSETQNRSLHELFDLSGFNGTISARGNHIQCATAASYIRMSRALNLMPAFSAANLSDDNMFTVSNSADAQIVTLETSDLPAGAAGYGFKCTGGSAWYSPGLAIDPLRPVRFSGWSMRNSSNHIAQLRWLDRTGAVISVDNATAAGTTGSWVRIGGSHTPPRGAVFVRPQVALSGSQIATDTIIAADWCIEQI